MRYVSINGEWVPIDQVERTQADGVMIQPDIQPYQSMADGSMITSRSQHREHLKKHNCFEVGNEKMESKPVVVTDTRREVLQSQLANMTHSQANKVLSRLRDDIRFTRK